tara:strand:+ start:143 stop:445 length:303 start_codon:yes stop_codon:yes gene_type:complete
LARKKKEKKRPIGIQEFEGFRVGDIVWYELVDGRIGRGKIQSFSIKDLAGPTLCVWDEINHGYRSGLVSKASFEAPPTGQKVLNRAAAQRARAENANKKK